MAMMMSEIDASPTKRFFVQMLTRDIELKDAILDLLDNCVDGIVRSIKDNKGSQPYNGYWAKISASPERFLISDNCGGIPKDVLINTAFRQGRPEGAHSGGAHTVGMYGIGMKRAMFKLGRSSKLITKSSDVVASVEITPEWLEQDKQWALAPKEEDPAIMSVCGTQILVKDLYENISSHFSERESDFISELKDSISQQYARIIEKGFSIYVNDSLIRPVDLSIYFDPNNDSGVQPYMFKGFINDVSVDLIVGFHRRLASERELEEELIEPRKSSDAGWTIICNDRVVLYKDRSRVTGWGLGKVPSYHTQFISISGQVEFKSKELFNLPLNTTKRGVDLNSDVYITILQEMMNGLKMFTDFTNKWKGKEQETNRSFSLAQHGKPEEAMKIFETHEQKWTKVRNITNASDARRYIPTLPVPPNESKNRRIVFSKPVEQVAMVSNYLTGVSDTAPSEIGSFCFDRIYKKAVEEGGNAS